MANELTQTTINALGTGWIDSTPGATSTGYQAQNTNIQARTLGQDLSSVRVSGTDIIVDISGPIDVDGTPFSITSAVTLTPYTGGVQYIKVVDGSTTTQKSLELTTNTPVWDASKNALYDSGDRVLNWEILPNETIRLNRIKDPQYLNTALGSSEQTIGNLGFTRWNDLMPLTYPYYFDSFVPIANASKMCVIGGDLYVIASTTLYHFDGISNSLLDSFTHGLGNVSGITYDYVSNNLLLCTQNTLYIMDGISSTVLTSFAISTFTNGIAFDGTNLIRVDGDLGSGGSNFVRIHDGITSTVLTSISISTSYIRGVTYDGNNIICGGMNLGATASFIYVLKGETSSLHFTLDAFGTTAVDGISDFAHDGRHLISLNSNNDTIYVHGFI